MLCRRNFGSPQDELRSSQSEILQVKKIRGSVEARLTRELTPSRSSRELGVEACVCENGDR